MRKFKVFIQAVRQGPEGREERMFSYAEEAEDGEAARARAKGRFELEQALAGWAAESAGVLELPG